MEKLAASIARCNERGEEKLGHEAWHLVPGAPALSERHRDRETSAFAAVAPLDLHGSQSTSDFLRLPWVWRTAALILILASLSLGAAQSTLDLIGVGAELTVTGQVYFVGPTVLTAKYQPRQHRYVWTSRLGGSLHVYALYLDYRAPSGRQAIRGASKVLSVPPIAGLSGSFGYFVRRDCNQRVGRACFENYTFDYVDGGRAVHAVVGRSTTRPSADRADPAYAGLLFVSPSMDVSLVLRLADALGLGTYFARLQLTGRLAQAR